MARLARLNILLGALALACLAAAFLTLDREAAAAALRRLDARTALAVAGTVLLAYTLRFLKWNLFVRRLGLAVPVGRSAALFASGLLMILTPAKLGEVWKAFALQERQGIPVGRSLPAVVLERFADMAAVSSLALLASATLGSSLLAGVAAAAACATAVVVLRQRAWWLRRLDRLAGRRPGSRAVGLLQALYEGAHQLLALRTLLPALGIALVAWALEGYALHLILAGLGADVPVLAAIGIFCLGTIAGLASLLPGGVGTAEVAMGILLVGAGVDAPTAAAATLLARLATLGLGAAIGAAAFAGWTVAGRRARERSERDAVALEPDAKAADA